MKYFNPKEATEFLFELVALLYKHEEELNSEFIKDKELQSIDGIYLSGSSIRINYLTWSLCECTIFIDTEEVLNWLEEQEE